MIYLNLYKENINKLINYFYFHKFAALTTELNFLLPEFFSFVVFPDIA